MKYALSPSKAHRFLRCTASLLHDKKEEETAATIRGRQLHEYAYLKLTNQDYEEFAEIHQINDYEENLINCYVNAVLEEAIRIGATKRIFEKKESASLYFFNFNYIIDALLIGGDTASIIDLKTGNIDVEVENNEQLLFYAHDVSIKYPKIKKFRLSIFQKMRMKTQEIQKQDIIDFFLEKYDIFEEIHSEDLKYRPSEKACQWCAIKNTCIARANWIVRGKPDEYEV